VRRTRRVNLVAALATFGLAATFGAAPTAAQYYYYCPPGYYYSPGYGCIANPPYGYYYAPPPPPVVYPAPPLFSFGLGFAFGGHDRDDFHHDHDWHRH